MKVINFNLIGFSFFSVFLCLCFFLPFFHLISFDEEKGWANARRNMIVQITPFSELRMTSSGAKTLP